MNILTVENNVYNLDSVPDEIDDLRYCVLDVNDPEYYDYFWHPLVFLESFYSPAIVLNIGGNEIQMPMDWSIAICDDECHTEVEIVPLTSLNNRGFRTPVFNPMDNKIPRIEEISFTIRGLSLLPPTFTTYFIALSNLSEKKKVLGKKLISFFSKSFEKVLKIVSIFLKSLFINIFYFIINNFFYFYFSIF